MYNGIGLTTPRGSGTNGYVQRNLAFVKLSKEKPEYRSEEDIKRSEAVLNRPPNQEILDHERLRKVELKCFELRELMTDQAYGEDEIESKVNQYRQLLLQQMEVGSSDPRGQLTTSNLVDDQGRPVARETHQIAELQQEKNERLKRAFGIADDYVSGSAVRREKPQPLDKEKVKRDLESEDSENSDVEEIIPAKLPKIEEKLPKIIRKEPSDRQEKMVSKRKRRHVTEKKSIKSSLVNKKRRRKEPRTPSTDEQDDSENSTDSTDSSSSSDTDDDQSSSSTPSMTSPSSNQSEGAFFEEEARHKSIKKNGNHPDTVEKRRENDRDERERNFREEPERNYRQELQRNYRYERERNYRQELQQNYRDERERNYREESERNYRENLERDYREEPERDYRDERERNYRGEERERNYRGKEPERDYRDERERDYGEEPERNYREEPERNYRDKRERDYRDEREYRGRGDYDRSVGGIRERERERDRDREDYRRSSGRRR